MGKWKTVRFGDYFERITRRNNENNTNVLTVSANFGLVNQKEFFRKIVASKSLRSYYLLYNGEFVYNKSYCDGYPMGAFKRLDNYDKGVVTTLYICFAPSSTKICPDFYLHYFEAGMMNDALYNIAQEGARNHGLLNVGVDKFFDMPIPLPPLPTQRRIAAILTAADEAIAASRALVEKYANIKAGLMQDLLGEGEPTQIGKLGGKFFRGNGISRAEITKEGVPCIRYGELYTVYDTLITEVYSYTGEQTARYCRHIKYGDLLFTLSGETAEDIGKTVAYIGNEDVVIGGDLAVLTRHGQNPIYLSYMLNGTKARKQKELAGTGASVVHINSTKLEKIVINLPIIERQNEIAAILTATDNQLRAERDHLAKLEDIKRGLMHDLLTNTVSTDRLQEGAK